MSGTESATGATESITYYSLLLQVLISQILEMPHSKRWLGR